jgi:protein gp37
MPTKIEWCDECKAAGVPFFFKGWGTWQKYEGELSKPEFGMINGVEYKEFPK